MKYTSDNSMHLIVTSPPYWNAKEYSDNKKNDLGNIDDYDLWLEEINKVWEECFRVLQPGRKMFVNIMDLPIKFKNGYKLIPLKGDTINLLQEIGFVLKQEIIWEKTNGVRSHFGSYPRPGGILLNNMHESILEFEKPCKTNYKKYQHLTKEQIEKSLLTKDDWVELKKSNVWKMKPYKSKTREHIAPFPLELPERLVKAYSFIGEKVLDPFGGSGTTLVACHNLERKGFVYEINKDFENMIINKLIDNGVKKQHIHIKKDSE